MIKSKFIQKAIFPTAVALGTFASLFVIASTGAQSPGSKLTVQSTNVSALPLQKQLHTTTLKGFGEIVPAEITQLSTRVSGTVVEWSDKFVRGGIVKKGEVLFRLEDSRYQAELKNAESELFGAKAVLERELGLAKVAKSELERINASERNRLFLREPQINSAYAAVSSAEARLISAKYNLESTVSRAPFDALVVERNLGLGQYVVEGSSVAVLYNVETAEVIVPLAKFDSQFLPNDLSAQTAKVSLPGSQLTTQGQLSRDLKLTDAQTRSNSLVVTIKNLYQNAGAGNTFQFGDYVEVEFNGKAINDVYRVPESLVSNNQVWIMNGEFKLERRDVDVVRNENGYAIVKDGFKSVDKLVTTLPEYPYQGMPVKLITAGNEGSGDKL